jgi:hypothetical protein
MIPNTSATRAGMMAIHFGNQKRTIDIRHSYSKVILAHLITPDVLWEFLVETTVLKGRLLFEEKPKTDSEYSLLKRLGDFPIRPSSSSAPANEASWKCASKPRTVPSPRVNRSG